MFYIDRLIRLTFIEKLRVLCGKPLIVTTIIPHDFFAGNHQIETQILTGKFFGAPSPEETELLKQVRKN